MPSERVQRQIDRLLDEAEIAVDLEDWEGVRSRARRILALDPENPDARNYLEAAERSLAGATAGSEEIRKSGNEGNAAPASLLPDLPTSFAGGRYLVKRFLGEGGKKRVYLAHDTLLDRDVAFAVIKTEGLDDEGRRRIQREA